MQLKKQVLVFRRPVDSRKTNSLGMSYTDSVRRHPKPIRGHLKPAIETTTDTNISKADLNQAISVTAELGSPDADSKTGPIHHSS